MKKGTKITLISSAVLIAGGGALLMLNPKLRLKLGLPVNYRSDNNGEKYSIVFSKYGDSVVLSAMQNDALKYFITLDNGVLMSNRVTVTADGETTISKTEITNEKDKKYFSKFF
jgi:hypothetical protein